MFQRMGNFLWRNRQLWFGLIVVATVAAVLILPQRTAGFPDADSYYHGMIAQIMVRTHDFARSYPWFTYMTWKDGISDGHLGFHVLLMPFVGLWGVELGMKIAAVIFGALALYALYRTLRYYQVSAALWLVWIGALTNPFIFRMALPRAPSVALIMFLPLMIVTIRQQVGWVFLLSFIFAWAYHSWPITILFMVVVLVAQLLLLRTHPRGQRWPVISRQLTVTGANLAGIVLSYVINPYFPRDIIFSWLDIFKIGFFNDRQAIRVGGEWYPLGSQSFIQSTLPLILIVCVVWLVIYMTRRQKLQDLIADFTPEQRLTAVTFGLFSFILFYLATGSQRYFEYLIPSALIFCGLLLNRIEPFWHELKRALSPNPSNRYQRAVSRLIYVVLILAPMGYYASQFRSSITPSHSQNVAIFKPALQALDARLPAGSVIFQNRWDDGPTLAFGDPNLRYLIGLDPTFFADYDRASYNVWQKILTSPEPDLGLIKSRLGASGVILHTLNNKRPADTVLGQSLAASQAWEQVYASPDVQAYVWQGPTAEPQPL